MKKQLILLGLGSALVLAGCGGGGGGGGSPGASTPVSTLSTVTATNATPVAGSAFAGSLAISESTSPLSGMLAGVSIGGAKVSVVGPALDLVRKVYPRTTPLLTGVTVTEACSGGGSMTVDANLRNPQAISNGDTMTITANNCFEDGDLINGAFSVAMSNITGDIMNSYNWGATLDTKFNNFAISTGAERATINGDMKIVISQTSATNSTLTVSGKSLQLAEQRSGVKLGIYTLADYSMNGVVQGTSVRSAANFTISGNTTNLGQFSYAVKNLQPFMSNGQSMPYTGSLIVNGASSSVTLTVTSVNGARLDFSAKGDATITQTSNLSWTELLAGL